MGGDIAGVRGGAGGVNDTTTVEGGRTVGGESGGAQGLDQAGEPAASGSAGAEPGVGGGSEGPAWGGCSTAIFCDDFESYETVPGAPWKAVTSGGTVAIDLARHASGSKSVRFTTSGGEAYERALLTYDSAFPLTPNELYGRVRVLTYGLPKVTGGHWNLIKAAGEPSVLQVGGQADALLTSFFSQDTGDCWQHSKTLMPVGEWACLEWHFDGTSNTAEVWLNEAPVEDLTVVGMGETCTGDQKIWTFPSFTSASIGLEQFGKDQARDVWMDDFALDTVRIRCAP